MGDLNKHIGNDELGVKDNHSKISFGGKCIRDLLSGGNYICMNNSKKAKGGPFTRFDPSKPTDINEMSCLDLIIASSNLEPFIKCINIDSQMNFSPSGHFQRLNL